MIRGRTKPVNTVEQQSNINIHNRFDIEVIDAKTKKVKQTARAYNVLCDNIWTNICNFVSYFGYIAYGSGSGTPSSSDTRLFAGQIIKEASNVALNVDRFSGIGWRTRKIVLNETTSVGMTITEVGISSSSSSGYLCSHAMLQDMNGNPISITKTDTDIITIYATVYAHWNPRGHNGIHIGGGGFTDVLLGYGYNALPYGSWPNEYGPSIICSKGLYRDGSTSGSMSSTVDRSAKKRTMAFPRIAIGDDNCGGFGWIMLGKSDRLCTDAYFIADVRGSYPVYSEAVGTGDGVTTSFATKFDLPMNATVYVDGKIVNDVTVKKEPITLSPVKYLVRIASKLTADGHHVVYQPSESLTSGGYMYFYNQLHDIGLYSWSRNASSYYGMLVAFSDDMVNWSSEYSNAVVVPDQYRHMKYLRIRCAGTNSSGTLGQHTMSFPPEVTGKNIVFDEPPAEGAVITIDYITPFVPKDENHVYDFSLTIQFGEYAES